MNKKSIRTLSSLTQNDLVKKSDLSTLQKVVENFSISITDQMHQLIDKSDPDDPIAKQFVPHIKELNISPIEHTDPIGDDIHTTVKGVIHRYPDRCLFVPLHVCPVYCRFCFRKEKVGTPSETLTSEELENAFTYINDHQEIWEVIMTGGDPLILKPTLLKKFIDRLNAIDHVEVIRIHTRVPIVESVRINAEMVTALKCDKPVYVLLHANHPKEFTKDAIKACAALVDAGIPMLSQTTLLKNLNDDIETLSALMRCFIKNRIKPYYLHHGDLAKGTEHFRTSIAEGQRLMKQLRGRFSGMCQPTYVLDIPGGHGKVPIGPSYIQMDNRDADIHNEAHYCVEDYRGGTHHYP
ncbi:MAG: lysine-2,3-aminomutase-like protein [Gammaproteobacteria bacterium]|nr:lysine-2,3-aminomutase-like protein [Gammaproteobacteria bacterium]MCW5583649.1 lysine-2,3-aminomutase-like protein [Gammaproteobacteria bacterium]